MSIDAMRAAHADLGEGWLRQQLARLDQRHLQLGRHFRVDVAAVLAAAARQARATARGAHPCQAATPPPVGDLLPAGNFERCSASEWLAVTGDQTEVVVPDALGAPHPLAIAKAAAVLQARDDLVGCALQLVEPNAAARRSWQLVTLDIGAAAARRNCEFLMCFALDADSGGTAYAEVAYDLVGQEIGAPLFIASVHHGIGSPGSHLQPTPDRIGS